MAQAYSDPSREADEHTLPDVEVFQLTARRGLREGCVMEDSELLSIALANIAQRRRARRRDALGALALAGAGFTCATAAAACATVLWLLTHGRI